MRAPAMVVRPPLRQDSSEMALVERNQPVQTLSADGSGQPFTECVGLRRPHRVGGLHLDPQGGHTRPDLFGLGSNPRVT